MYKIIFNRLGKWPSHSRRIIALALITPLILSTSTPVFAGKSVFIPKPVSPKKEASKFKYNINSLEPSLISIPSEFGTVKETYKGTNGKLIVHIQDAHTNYDAQKNEAGIIEHLINNYNLRLVLLEGGTRDDNIDFLRQHATPEKRREVAEKHLQKGAINCAEYLDLATDYNLDLQGVEDGSLYEANVEAFKKINSFKDQSESILKAMKGMVDALKPKIFHAQLKGFDDIQQKYANDKITLVEFYQYMGATAERMKIALEGYPNFNNFIKANKLEGKIDVEKANNERAKLLDNLSNNLSKEDMSLFLMNSMDYRQGRASAKIYYDQLTELAKKINIDIKKAYPNLHKYMEYASKVEIKDPDELFKEADKLEASIKEALFKNDDQRNLDEIQKDIALLQNFLNISLAPGDLNRFESNRDKFNTTAWLSFLQDNIKKYKLSNPANLPTNVIDNNLQDLYSFYQAAKDRDFAILRNLERLMQEKNEELAAMPLGGFHTEQVMRLLRENGYSYIVVSPKVAKLTDMDRYHYMLLNENNLDIRKIDERPNALKKLASDLVGDEKKTDDIIAAHKTDNLQSDQQILIAKIVEKAKSLFAGKTNNNVEQVNFVRGTSEFKRLVPLSVLTLESQLNFPKGTLAPLPGKQHALLSDGALAADKEIVEWNVAQLMSLLVYGEPIPDYFTHFAPTSPTGDIGAFSVKVDQNGKIVEFKKLREGGDADIIVGHLGGMRIASQLPVHENLAASVAEYNEQKPKQASLIALLKQALASDNIAASSEARNAIQVAIDNKLQEEGIVFTNTEESKELVEGVIVNHPQFGQLNEVDLTALNNEYGLGILASDGGAIERVRTLVGIGYMTPTYGIKILIDEGLDRDAAAAIVNEAYQKINKEPLRFAKETDEELTSDKLKSDAVKIGNMNWNGVSKGIDKDTRDAIEKALHDRLVEGLHWYLKNFKGEVKDEIEIYKITARRPLTFAFEMNIIGNNIQITGGKVREGREILAYPAVTITSLLTSDKLETLSLAEAGKYINEILQQNYIEDELELNRFLYTLYLQGGNREELGIAEEVRKLARERGLTGEFLVYRKPKILERIPPIQINVLLPNDEVRKIEVAAGATVNDVINKIYLPTGASATAAGGINTFLNNTPAIIYKGIKREIDNGNYLVFSGDDITFEEKKPILASDMVFVLSLEQYQNSMRELDDAIARNIVRGKDVMVVTGGVSEQNISHLKIANIINRRYLGKKEAKNLKNPLWGKIGRLHNENTHDLIMKHLKFVPEFKEEDFGDKKVVNLLGYEHPATIANVMNITFSSPEIKKIAEAAADHLTWAELDDIESHIAGFKSNPSLRAKWKEITGVAPTYQLVREAKFVIDVSAARQAGLLKSDDALAQIAKREPLFNFLYTKQLTSPRDITENLPGIKILIEEDVLFNAKGEVMPGILASRPRAEQMLNSLNISLDSAVRNVEVVSDDKKAVEDKLRESGIQFAVITKVERDEELRKRQTADWVTEPLLTYISNQYNTQLGAHVSQWVIDGEIAGPHLWLLLIIERLPEPYKTELAKEAARNSGGIMEILGSSARIGKISNIEEIKRALREADSKI